jgi:SAM-dependent methyltransferase
MRDPRAGLRESWIANADAWRDAVRERRIESRRLVTDGAIVSAVLECSPRRVLDLGCGEGWLARELARHGIAVTGVDASVPLVDDATASGGASFLAVTYESIIDDPSCAGSGYDVIVANFSLLDDRTGPLLAALRRTYDVSSVERSWLLVQTLHPTAVPDAEDGDGWRVESFAAMPGQWPSPMPWFFMTPKSWRATFAAAGYEVVATREPLHPQSGQPLSMLWICAPRARFETA